MSIEFDWVDYGSLPGASRLFRALMEREPVARERFPKLYWRGDDLRSALIPGSGSADFPLWDRVEAESKRLGASSVGLDTLRQVRAGKGVVVATGQQPGLLGGPLYTLYKIATAVELASWIHDEFSTPCASILWNAADDVDFDEVARATVVGDDLRQVRIALSREDPSGAGWVGAIPKDSWRGALHRVRPVFEGKLGGTWCLEVVEEAGRSAADAGEFFSALYLRLFAERGLLVLDARWPEVRRAAQGVFARYASEAARIHEEVSAAVEKLKGLGFERKLSRSATRFGLFVVEGGRRLDISSDEREAEARRRIGDRPETLSPNVLLRPIVQDALLRTAIVVLGPGEVGYWAGIREGYERLGVDMPVVWPRLTATLVPREVEVVLGGERGARILSDLDSLIHARQWNALPEGISKELRDFGNETERRLDSLKNTLGEVDRGLVDVIESVQRKMEFQTRRIGDQAVRKLRQRSPDLAVLNRVRELVYPNGRLQERVLSALWPLALRGPDFVDDLLSLARAHRERLLAERGAHAVVRLPENEATRRHGDTATRRKQP